jgi:hypothetical protein
MASSVALMSDLTCGKSSANAARQLSWVPREKRFNDLDELFGLVFRHGMSGRFDRHELSARKRGGESSVLSGDVAEQQELLLRLFKLLLENVSELLDDPKDEASSLVHTLHGLMTSHTGGDWKKFVLAIDPTGKATTQFAYEASMGENKTLQEPDHQ